MRSFFFQNSILPERKRCRNTEQGVCGSIWSSAFRKYNISTFFRNGKVADTEQSVFRKNLVERLPKIQISAVFPEGEGFQYRTRCFRKNTISLLCCSSFHSTDIDRTTAVVLVERTDASGEKAATAACVPTCNTIDRPNERPQEHPLPTHTHKGRAQGGYGSGRSEGRAWQSINRLIPRHFAFHVRI